MEMGPLFLLVFLRSDQAEGGEVNTFMEQCLITVRTNYPFCLDLWDYGADWWRGSA